MEHLLELRKRIIVSLIGFIVIFICLVPFANNTYSILAIPLLRLLPNGNNLIATDIASVFFIPLKLTALLSFLINLPHIMYQLWKFFSSALYNLEKKVIIYLSIASNLLFLIGLCFCYFIVIPIVLHFLITYNNNLVTIMPDISTYLEFTLSLFWIFAISFQLPIIIFSLLKFKVVTIQQLHSYRSYTFIGCFIISAVITPPDILSQTLLAIPLYILFELGLLAYKISIWFNKAS